MSPWLNKLHNALRTLITPLRVYVGGGDRAAALEAFDAWCARHEGASCELGLSGHWIHSCVLPQEASSLPMAQQRDYAVRQFDHYFTAGVGSAPGSNEATGTSWAVAASEDEAVPLVCAVARDFIDALNETAAKHHVRLRRVLPWWARGVERALSESGVGKDASKEASKEDSEQALDVTAALEPGLATLIVTRGQRVQRVLTDTSLQLADWQARLQPAGDESPSDAVFAVRWRRLHLAEGELPGPVSDAPQVGAVLFGRAGLQARGV